MQNRRAKLPTAVRHKIQSVIRKLVFHGLIVLVAWALYDGGFFGSILGKFSSALFGRSRDMLDVTRAYGFGPGRIIG